MSEVATTALPPCMRIETAPLKARESFAIVCGVIFLLVGILQFLYSFLACASVVVVDLLGAFATLASSAIGAVPNEPYEIPYARALAMTIAVTGMVFSIASLFTCCRFFYLRRAPKFDLIISLVLCAILSALHLMNSLSLIGAAYILTGTMVLIALLVDRYLDL